MSDVYLAASTTRLPCSLAPELAMDVLYPAQLEQGRLHRLAQRAARAVGIAERPFVRDHRTWPARTLARDEYRPLAWCTGIVEQLSGALPRGELGCLSVAYNISSEPDLLPSVSARVAAALGLALEQPPDERVFLGCAGGLFSLADAYAYCSHASKAGLVCAFDQCSWLASPIHDDTHPEFRDRLRASLLFGDAAAGLLLVPAALRPAFRRPLPRILDLRCEFVPGMAVRLDAGALRFGQGLEREVPELVAARLVRPMLARHGLDVAAIAEWSLHQGGRPLLERFGEGEVLGLSPAQRRRSLELFERYGNLSAASSLVVLDSFMNAAEPAKPGTKGMVVAFGAGYYMAALLYEWEAP
jgi:predicted naringenin-chalcone synthase